MTDDEYLAAQQMLTIAAGGLDLHDWAAFIQRINHAETMGVFLMAPLDYQRATERARHISAMASAASALVKAFSALNDVAARS